MKALVDILNFIREQTGVYALDITYGESGNSEDDERVTMSLVAYKDEKYCVVNIDIDSLVKDNAFNEVMEIIHKINFGLMENVYVGNVSSMVH